MAAEEAVKKLLNETQKQGPSGGLLPSLQSLSIVRKV
jgi:hypothetical protein